MNATRLVLAATMMFGTAGLIGCASDSDSRQSLPPGENGRTAGGNGAFGENPDRPGEYAAPNTGTTNTDRGPAAANNGAAK